MKKLLLFALVIVLASLSLQSCKKDKATMDADEELFDQSIGEGFVYYQDAALLDPTQPSPHGTFKLRFNATAAAALDSTGELPEGSTFPTGSIIVKDVYDGGSLDLYAVMKKDPSNEYAGSGWLWAEYDTDGSVVYSLGKKGEGCIGCHSGTPNRDLVRTFDLH